MISNKIDNEIASTASQSNLDTGSQKDKEMPKERSICPDKDSNVSSS